MMRQLLYISSSKRGEVVDIGRILDTSRHNNAIDGVTGLLWTDAVRFLQVLEGPPESVSATFARIGKDPRHHAIVILSDRTIEHREFGHWSMSHAVGGEDGELYRERITRLLSGASESVRQTFLGLIEARSAQQSR